MMVLHHPVPAYSVQGKKPFMILNITISKAGKSIPIDSDMINELPPAMQARILEEGLKVLLNAKMTKVKTKDLVDDELVSAQSAAMVIAAKNLDDLKAGKLTKRGSSAATKGVDRKIVTEAMRLGRNHLKSLYREKGGIVSRVEASVWTAGAKQLIESDPQFMDQAKINLEETATKPTVAIDLEALGIAASPKLVAEAEAKKLARKGSLSATQAGKVAPRRREAAPQHTH